MLLKLFAALMNNIEDNENENESNYDQGRKVSSAERKGDLEIVLRYVEQQLISNTVNLNVSNFNSKLMF